VTDVQRIIARQALLLTETANSLQRDCQLLRRRITAQAARCVWARLSALQEFNPELRAKMKPKA